MLLAVIAIHADAQVTFAGAVTVLGGNYTTFNNPNGIVIDSLGDVFVADCGSNSVKKFAATNGVLPNPPVATTLALQGLGICPNGLAVDAKNNLYVASNGSTAIQVYMSAGGTYAGAPIMVGSTFAGPTAVAVDGNGNVFVADRGNKAVKKIVASGGMTNSNSATIPLGPPGSTYFQLPTGVAVDKLGNLFVVASATCLIEILAAQLTAPASLPQPLCSGATVPGRPGQFTQVYGIAVDANDTVYVTDAMTGGFGEVKKVLMSASSPTLTVTEQVSGILGRSLIAPSGIAVDSQGNLAVVDSSTNIAAVFNMTSPVNFGTASLGSESNGMSLSFVYNSSVTEGPITVTGNNLDFFDVTSGICLPMTQVNGYRGNTCTVDLVFKPSQFGSRTGTLQLMDTNNAVLATVPLTGMAALLENPVSGTFDHPEGIAAGPGGVIYVSDTVDRRIMTVGATGGAVSLYGYVPFGSVAVDKMGNIFFADTRNNTVDEIPVGNLVAKTIASGFAAPRGVALDSSGNIYVADSNNRAVKKVSPTGAAWSVTTVVAYPQVIFPTGVALDAAGDLFVCDPTASSVQYFKAASATTFYPGSGIIGGFNTPWGIAVDPVSNNLFVADSDNNSVKELLAPGYNGAISLATDFNHPMAVAADGLGNVYVADTNGNRVVKLVVNVAVGVP